MRSGLVNRLYPHKVFAQARIYNPEMTTPHVMLGQGSFFHFGQNCYGCSFLGSFQRERREGLLYGDGPTKLLLSNWVLLQLLISYTTDCRDLNKEGQKWSRRVPALEFQMVDFPQLLFTHMMSVRIYKYA